MELHQCNGRSKQKDLRPRDKAKGQKGGIKTNPKKISFGGGQKNKEKIDPKFKRTPKAEGKKNRGGEGRRLKKEGESQKARTR